MCYSQLVISVKTMAWLSIHTCRALSPSPVLPGGRIHLGQVFTCMVTSVKNLRAVGMCIDPKEINSSTVSSPKPMSLLLCILSIVCSVLISKGQIRGSYVMRYYSGTSLLRTLWDLSIKDTWDLSIKDTLGP